MEKNAAAPSPRRSLAETSLERHGKLNKEWTRHWKVLFDLERTWGSGQGDRGSRFITGVSGVTRASRPRMVWGVGF